MDSFNRQSPSLYTAYGQRKYISALERPRFLEAAWACPHPDQRTLCLFVAEVGPRISEAIAVTRRAIAFDLGFVAIRSLKKRAKTPIIRCVPMPPDLIAELEAVYGREHANPDEPLWPITRSQAWRWIKEIMAQAGISGGPHATPKGLRHGFGVHAVHSRIPDSRVQRWLGHTHLETTAIYLDVMGEDERQIASRMWSRQATIGSGQCVCSFSQFDSFDRSDSGRSASGMGSNRAGSRVNWRPDPSHALPCCQYDPRPIGAVSCRPHEAGRCVWSKQKTETNMQNANERKRPTHAIFQVLGDDDKARWIKVGAAWPNKDGKGYSLVFDAVPLTGRTVMREIVEQDGTTAQTN